MKTYLRSLKNEIINGIELYSVSSIATDTFQKEAHQQSSFSNMELERKLTAIVLAAQKVGEISESKNVYRFGGFVLTVNEKTRKIEVVHWYKDNHGSKVTKEQNIKLREYYKLLGLNRNGGLRHESNQNVKGVLDY